MNRFLTPDGKNLPGVSEKDTITYRIEALRVFLEDQMGEDTFYQAYKYLMVYT